MKNNKFRLLSILLIAVMCFSSSSLAIFAEDEIADGSQVLVTEPAVPAPAIANTVGNSVTHTEYSLAGKYISFTWNKVEDYSGKDIRYALRMWKGSGSFENGTKIISVTELTKNSYNSTKGLRNINTYRYQVVSYHKGDNPVWTSAPITTISFPDCANLPLPTSFTAKFTYASKAKNSSKLGEIKQKDNTVSVKWTVDNPSLYSHMDLVRVTTKGSVTKIATVTPTTKTSYTFKDLSPKGVHYYKLYMYANQPDCKCVYKMSDSVTGPNVPDGYLTTSTVKTNHTWSAVAKQKLKVYDEPGGDVVATVTKDTSLDATGGYAPDSFGFWETPSWVEVEYDGDTCWVKWSQVKLKWHLTYKDYAWSVKEKYINNGDWDSNTNYLIWVSRYTHRTNVFHKEKGKWVLKKVYDCNTGNYYQPLKGGQYYIRGHESIKYKIHRNGREYYFQYSTKFGGSGTFHTRCRWSDTNSLRNAIKRHPTTKGCCRLYDAAAKYIYNLPNGTGVVIK